MSSGLSGLVHLRSTVSPLRAVWSQVMLTAWRVSSISTVILPRLRVRLRERARRGLVRWVRRFRCGSCGSPPVFEVADRFGLGVGSGLGAGDVGADHRDAAEVAGFGLVVRGLAVAGLSDRELD